MSSFDINKVSETLKECASLYVLPRFKALQEHEISSKTGPRDLVTQADIDVERHLERVLPYILPGSVVVGEEGVSRGEASIETLLDTDQATWVVDPVDGTYNFVNGRDEFGIMLACVQNGVTTHGWIYDVPADSMTLAEKGSGAFTDGRKNRVKDCTTVKDMLVHANPSFFPKALREDIKYALDRFGRSHSLGSAAHEYVRIAKGQADVSIYSRMKPWDHLPGALIVEEAGGYVAKWDRSPYTSQDLHKGLIVTTSPDNWRRVWDVIALDVDLGAYI